MGNVCPGCESSLVVSLNEPWEYPAVFRCMLCSSTFVGGALAPAFLVGRASEPPRLPATQVKMRIVADGGLLDPLGWAREGARRLEWVGDPIAAAGVGGIREAPTGAVEITFLLLVRGPNDPVEASERAHRRVAQVLGGDPSVVDIQTMAAVPLYAAVGGHRSPSGDADPEALRSFKAR